MRIFKAISNSSYFIVLILYSHILWIYFYDKNFKMPLRGPYKQYEVDTSISVPKSTSYDRRKRRLV
jgi:hypothetical protein